MRLRYRLMPYIYAAFVHAAETGAPVQRPLVFDHQDDPAVRDLDDEYLFGRDLLVAPVLRGGADVAAGLPARRRLVRLAHRRAAPRAASVSSGADAAWSASRSSPAAARSIPMWPEAPPSTDGYHPGVIELHVFVPTVDGEHRSLLQEDDGLTFAADRGRRYRSELTLTRSGDRLELRADVDGEGYPEFAREAFRLVVHGAQPASVRLDGAGVRAVDGAFLLPNAGQGMVVEIDL